MHYFLPFTNESEQKKIYIEIKSQDKPYTMKSMSIECFHH